MNEKVSVIDKLFGKILQSVILTRPVISSSEKGRCFETLFFLLYCFYRETNDRYKHNGIP